jgi:hypothetical protein
MQAGPKEFLDFLVLGIKEVASDVGGEVETGSTRVGSEW